MVTTERCPGPSISSSSPYDGRLARPLILRAAELPNHFMMHSFSVGGASSTFGTGAAMDEIMKIGAWKTESISEYKIGATSSGQGGSKKKRCHSYVDASELPLPLRVRETIEAMLRRSR